MEAEGISPLVFQGSVADAAHVQETVAALAQAWGGVDVLVNNAGVNQILPDRAARGGRLGPRHGRQRQGRLPASRGPCSGPMIRARAGHILNIGSFASERVIEAPVHYAAAKSALRGMTESLAREVGRYNIKVNLLSPGLLDAGLSRRCSRGTGSPSTSQCLARPARDGAGDGGAGGVHGLQTMLALMDRLREARRRRRALMATRVDEILSDGLRRVSRLRQPAGSAPHRAHRRADARRDAPSTAAGQLIRGGERVEDLHGTQAFGHRHPAIAAGGEGLLGFGLAVLVPLAGQPAMLGASPGACASARGYSNAFFASSGSEGVEAALKLARAATGKPRVISLDGAYHGCTMGSCALMKPGMFKDPFGRTCR